MLWKDYRKIINCVYYVAIYKSCQSWQVFVNQLRYILIRANPLREINLNCKSTK